MSSGERPIGAAKGKQSDIEALCQTPAGEHLYTRPPLSDRSGSRGLEDTHGPNTAQRHDSCPVAVTVPPGQASCAETAEPQGLV